MPINDYAANYLTISPEEQAAHALSADNLRAAGRAMNEDGFVVLKDAISLDHLAVLREKMLADVAAFLARDDVPFNFNRSNIQQDPPPFPPYLFPDVLLNEFAIGVTRAVLGAGLKNAFYSGNTAMPSDLRQPVHADTGQLWENLAVATPPFALVVNVPVVPMSAENGSTELWAGTHRDTSVAVSQEIKIAPELLERRRADVPPIQPTAPLGSLLIRDIRLWHAGMPNRTATPRPMIAMIHYVSWWHGMPPLKFPKDTADFFQHPVLHTHAEYVETPIDYIHAPQAYDFKEEAKA